MRASSNGQGAVVIRIIAERGVIISIWIAKARAVHQRDISDLGLACLQLQDPLFNAVLNKIASDGYRVLLAKPVNAVDGLALNTRVPERVHQEHMGRIGQVESNTASSQRQQKHLDFWIRLEQGQVLITVHALHLAIQARKPNVALSQQGLDEVEHRGPLREHHTLFAQTRTHYQLRLTRHYRRVTLIHLEVSV
ncbi:hypothetical protein GGI13_005129, partial [Coemansia sp. RSA 455]